MHFLSSLFTTLQQHLFPFQQEALGELSEEHKTLIEVAEVASIEKFMSPFGRKPMGRPRHGRQPEESTGKAKKGNGSRQEVLVV